MRSTLRCKKPSSTSLSFQRNVHTPTRCSWMRSIGRCDETPLTRRGALKIRKDLCHHFNRLPVTSRGRTASRCSAALGRVAWAWCTKPTIKYEICPWPSRPCSAWTPRHSTASKTSSALWPTSPTPTWQPSMTSSPTTVRCSSPWSSSKETTSSAMSAASAVTAGWPSQPPSMPPTAFQKCSPWHLPPPRDAAMWTSCA